MIDFVRGMRMVSAHLGANSFERLHPLDHVVVSSHERPHAMLVDGVAVLWRGWTPPPLPWRWRNRFTRRLLRILGRRMPFALTAPDLTFDLLLNGIRIAQFHAAQVRDDGTMRFDFDALLLPSRADLTARIDNLTDQTIEVTVSAFGRSVT